MAKSTVPDAGIEPLFLVTPDGMRAVIPSAEPFAVGVEERAILLGETLTLLSQANSVEAFPNSDFFKEKLGGNVLRAQRGAKENAGKLRNSALQTFYRAYGLPKMLDSLPEDDKKTARQYKQLANRAFSDFKHGIVEETKEQRTVKQLRDVFRITLGGNAIPERNTQKRTTKPSNKGNGTQPQVQDQKTPTNKPLEIEEEQETGLQTREKLIIIAEDSRAGFLPTSNNEKTLVLTYLDYLDNLKYKLGAKNQLIEVANFQLRHHGTVQGMEYGVQAGRSIANEFADLYLQATKELADLEEVDALLYEIDNPNLSLAVALNADIEKAIPLIRFMDLFTFRATGVVSYTFKGEPVKSDFAILRSSRNEGLADDSRNKVVEDPYIAQERIPAVTKWLKKRTEQIKVGEIRKLILESIADQRMRQQFHKIVLEDFATRETDMPQLIEARKVALEVLAQFSQV